MCVCYSALDDHNAIYHLQYLTVNISEFRAFFFFALVSICFALHKLFFLDKKIAFPFLFCFAAGTFFNFFHCQEENFEIKGSWFQIVAMKVQK